MRLSPLARLARLACLVLGALIWAVAGPAAAQPVAEAPPLGDVRPALWQVSKGGELGWLFGTMHALPTLDWRTPPIKAAIAKADVFVFELEIDKVDVAVVRDLVMRYAFIEDGRTLPDVINARNWDEVTRLASNLGLESSDIRSMLPMRPWYASLFLTNRFFANEGFESGQGVEEALLAQLRSESRRTLSLETAEQQLAFLDGLSEPIQVAMLEATVRDLTSRPLIAQDMLRYWATGDTDKLAGLLNDALQDYPEAYDALLVARNQAWLPELMDLLASGKRIFVAVGAGHLVGRDSVVSLLRAEGYKVERAD